MASKTDQPPPGYYPAPGSKKGGFRDAAGDYWYPHEHTGAHAYITLKSPLAVDYPETAPPPTHDPEKLTYVGAKPGGAFEGCIAKHDSSPGKRFLVKPQSAVKALAERAGASLAAMVLGDGPVPKVSTVLVRNAPPAVRGSHGEAIASIQEMVPNSGDLPKSEHGLLALPQGVREQIVASAVANWLVSDHDAHGAQYLRTKDGKGVMRIDLGQCFKHIKEDRLDVDYHPNARFGEARPAPMIILRAFAEGRTDLDLDAPVIRSAIARASKIPDGAIEREVGRYGTAAERAGFGTKADYVARVKARRDSIAEDFAAFFGGLKAKRAGGGSLKKAISFEATLLKAAADYGITPYAEAALVGPDGDYTPLANRIAYRLASAVSRVYGPQRVSEDEATRDPEIGPLVASLAAAYGYAEDILIDPSLRAEIIYSAAPAAA